MLWNEDIQGFNKIHAHGAVVPQIAIDDEKIYIDGCECPPKILRIDPVGPIDTPFTGFPFGRPVSICGEFVDGETVIEQVGIKPDPIYGEYCSLPALFRTPIVITSGIQPDPIDSLILHSIPTISAP
jgi:hypothetical protein